MNPNILKAMGLHKEVARLGKGQCPTCGKAMMGAEFRDELSLKEAQISGMCQECQDAVFGDLEDPHEPEFYRIGQTGGEPMPTPTKEPK